MADLKPGETLKFQQQFFIWPDDDPDCQVSGIDIRPPDHPDIHTTDLLDNKSWMGLLKGVDVIVHLAGD
ncbi:hypothetical protein [Shimia sp.]|uniref:hypothetical protein n=1 Tax=Shimia sp. TaxID=1954381 RepID=UPI0032977BF1